MQFAATVAPGVTVGVIVVLLVGLSIIPALSYIGHHQRKAVMAFAEAQGWSYRDQDATLAARYSGDPFVTDVDARAEAVITGVFAGMPFAAYAYTYQASRTGGLGKQGTTTHSIPVVSLLLESGLPNLDVLPHDPLIPTWQPEAVSDVAIDSGEFDEAFAVLARDDGYACAVLHSRLAHDLMAYPDRSWSVRDGDILSIGSWNGKPEKITTYLDHLGMVVHSVPDAVWREFGGRPLALASGRDGDSDQPNSSSR
jgi:hypothetical protein